VLADWRRRRAAVAAAMYPAAMGHTRDEMPLMWTRAKWASAEARQQAEPIFDTAEYEGQLAAEAGVAQGESITKCPSPLNVLKLENIHTIIAAIGHVPIFK
jgi:hypothetical protein